jgi:type IV secretory pathway TrbL component
LERGCPLPGWGPLKEADVAVFAASSNYPFLNIFWTILIFFAWVAWIWIAITVFIDIFRRRDISGWLKAFWVILVVVLPFVGVLAYLLIYHDGMAERSTKEVATNQAQFDDYVRRTAGTGGPASEIEKGKQLLDSGAITQAEFDAIKAKAIGSAPAAA